MSRPELKFELDEYGRIVYRVTDEGVLLSKDEKEFIIDHVTRMQAENAKLREQMADMPNCEDCEAMLDCDECLRADSSQKERKRVDYENAKLRELVRDMNKWLWNGADCTECPFTAECDLNAAFESDMHANICVGWSEIHDRMRELGIEVGA